MLFRKKPEIPPPTAPGPLADDVAELKSQVRRLTADFEDLFDRFLRLQGRTAKREARAVPEETIDDQIRRARGDFARVVPPLNGG